MITSGIKLCLSGCWLRKLAFLIFLWMYKVNFMTNVHPIPSHELLTEKDPKLLRWLCGRILGGGKKKKILNLYFKAACRRHYDTGVSPACIYLNSIRRNMFKVLPYRCCEATQHCIVHTINRWTIWSCCDSPYLFKFYPKKCVESLALTLLLCKATLHRTYY